MKVTVSERAMQARINRKLAKEGKRLKKTQPRSRSAQELGEFYIVDEERNAIDAQHVDLDKLAQEMGTLKTGEKLED